MGPLDEGAEEGRSDSEDQRLADRLAEHDEALRAGREPAGGDSSSGDPEQRRGWEDLQACLWLVRRVLPEGSEGVSSTGSLGGSWPPPLEPGRGDEGVPEQLGRFRIERELGRGGFGVVFLAVDPVLNRRVALKVPQPGVLASSEGSRRSLREAQAAAVLDHPNVVPVFEAGQVGPVPYVASAYCEGEDLGAWLRRREGPVSARQAARLVASLAGAVQHAHERGILHRDLKPANVLMQRRPEGPEDGLEFIPRITDFGLATLIDSPEDQTLSGLLIGSPPYMAPEQAAGKRREIGPRTDVYALGAILYELVTGRPPHQGETPLETVHQVIAEEPAAPRRIRPSLPRDLETVILKCLAKEPDRRYASARALSDDLRRFLDGRPVQARPDGPFTLARLWAMSPRRVQDAGTLAMVFAGLLATWSLTGIVLAGLGVGLHPPRPGQYIATCLKVIAIDLVPAFFLGWRVRQGQPRALWAGTAFSVVRIGFQASYLGDGASDFGGLYEDPRFRLVVFAFILLTTAIVLLLHLVALAGWISRRAEE